MGPTPALHFLCPALLLLTGVALSQHPPSLDPPSNIVQQVNTVRVPYGRSVFINPVSDLNIQVEKNDHCFVKVLPDALSQRPGFISPNHFPCDFGPEDIKYSHLGARSPSEDHLRLQIRYDTPDETYIIPVRLTVEVLFIQRTVITTSLFLTVRELLGTSEAIDQDILGFTYDQANQQCQVATLSGSAGLPRYGNLINDPSQGSMMPCEDFLNAGVRYQHTTTTSSPNRDHIPMVVELLDADGNLIKQEYFQVTVKIVNGIENTPPRVDFAATNMMEVNQFVMTAFTNEMLRATDVESDPNDLIFNITQPPSFQQGEIVSTDDRNLRINSFRQSELNEYRIAYKPPTVDSDVQRLVEIEMQVIDTEGLVSEPFHFVIIVNPMNTMAPVVTRNTGQLLYQGQTRALSSSQNLEVSDENNLDEVRIRPLRQAQHGALSFGPQKFFTPADLDAGLVTYHHDGSNTYSDNIVFRMSDGETEVEFLFPITIAPLDNTPPNVDTNTGLVVSKGETKVVSSWVLHAADVDSDSLLAKFVLQEPYSEIGVFMLVINDVPDGFEADAFSLRPDGRWEKPITEWTQQEIMDMQVYYRHVGPHSTGVVMDIHPFRVQDNGDPPNKSDRFNFVVKVLPVDDIQPNLYPGTTLQMNVEEFELTPLKKKLLRYTDIDTNDKDLVYTITAPIVELNPITPLVDTGRLVLTENPNTTLTTFTQAQVNHHKVAYQPPNTELGLIPRALQFTFSVTDDAGNVLPDQLFTIFLRPVDNKPPRIVNTGFVVDERSTAIITPEILDATDEDTDENILTFELTSAPKYGVLQYEASPINLGGAFTRMDIHGYHIIYQHDGSEVTSDSFGLAVSDGMHTIPIVVRVTVQPIDDEQPLLAHLVDGTLDFTIEVPERGRVTITTDVLSATDSDTNDLALTYLIEEPAGKGVILVDGTEATSFTQMNIRDGVVEYEHVAGEIGSEPDSDMFRLTLSDMSDQWTVGGNRVERVDIQVKILPVDSEAPIVTVADDFFVSEGDKALIEPIHLLARDDDTNDDDILCVVTTQANDGFLENISPLPGSEKSRAGEPISSFTIGDIIAGNIYFVQSVHKGSEPIEDRFAFVCQDGTPNISDQMFLNIAIIPVNDETPRLFFTEFVVEEGGALVVDLPKLYAEDDDVPEDELIFTITDAPRNGVFLRNVEGNPIPISSFSLRDVATGSEIIYQHDDTETTEDKFEVTVSDGEHEVSQIIPITVIPVDDETPRMTINNGIDVEISETVIIGNDALKATDLDSEDRTLLYVITFGPQHGELNVTDGSGFSRIVRVGDNFTQDDIDNNRLTYTHTGQEGVSDLIKFDVTDGFNPLIDRYFYVSVAYLDMHFPDVINKGVTLKEGDRATLTTDILSTADINSADETLEFSIARAPTRGHLESTDNPGVPITTFTQLDLAGSKIQYVHTGGDEVKMDSFEFEVTDGFNPVYRTFRVSISDVDNKKPVVTITRLRVKEGSVKLISPFELKAEDRDTLDPKIRFHITQVPVHGKILMNERTPVRDFTMDDLHENRISYSHDGSETVADSFSFTVTDGTHEDFFVFPGTTATDQPQRMDIEIVPVDNGVPQMLVNRGAPSVSPLPSGDRGFRFTKKYLRADDRDSNVTNLLYVITIPAEHGSLVNIDNSNTSLETFSQGDIDNMKIYYILNPTSNASSDSFTFTVKDEGDNKLVAQQFRLNWALISFESATYSVTEDTKILEVTLKRRGYLGETSFVSIGTRDGTATNREDFKRKSASQVQFNPGQTTATWKVRILPDEAYEESENFYIELSEPVMAILEEPLNTTVTITDPEDESTVFIPKEQYKVEEDIGEINIPVRRSGDISNELMVICYTEPDEATGTTPSAVLSFSDYISRPEDHNSLITFGRGESEKFCRIVVIDDSLYEPDENFHVKLTTPMGGRLGNFSSSEIVVLADEDDEPLFYFDNDLYEVDESAGHLEVSVWRTGTDLTQTASVTVQSRMSDPESARVNEDYVGISRTLEFAPGITLQKVKVAILDDLGSPVLEGPETFDLALSMPMGAVLGAPSIATVVINDSISDLPLMQFTLPEVEVNEADGSLAALISRSGDLSQSASVRCFTRQASAEVMMDYAERPNTDGSLVHFEPGQSEARCTVVIEDDKLHEDPEKFRLVLGTPSSESAGDARLGEQTEILITINDDADKPIIEFARTNFEITEPETEDDISIVQIPVVRRGDLSQASEVRVYTKDGNALSGRDYNPVSKVLNFDEGVSEKIVEIEVLYDDEKEIRESFTVRLEPDVNMVAEIGEQRAIIYINQQRILADVTFPSKPNVISLRHYDDMANAPANPPSGYPVICVSPCNSKHSEFEEVSSLCESEGLDDSATRFRWLIAAPSGADGVTNPLREVAQNTFFTDTNQITLDSIYFQAGSRIACAARAVTEDGDVGLESISEPITVSSDEGICLPRVAGSVGAEPFSAKIRYTGPADSHPNLVKVTISMPHVDGMLPAISTRQLSNFEITLSKDGTRVGNHRCSNLINFDEIVTQYGFLTEATKNPNIVSTAFPYFYSAELRGNNTLRFYRNLNLEACLWEFTTYYDMSELLSECGGSIGTDGQVLDLVQSYVSLRVPLFVSYIFHSPVATGWQHFDQQTELRLTFVYDTAILWEKGIGTPLGSELQGYLYPTSMRIRDDGRLVVNFRTEARFRGQFVADHAGTENVAMVMSAAHPELQLSLNLVRSETTYNNPEQKWSFVSDYAIRDYSGSYTIKLIPCTTPAGQSYTIPIVCEPREPVTFDMDIRFQQVSDPVAAEFSLNTNFYLLSKKSLYLSDGSMGFAEESDIAFSQGAEIFGRVMVDPLQQLGSSFDASIEKVFVCSGRDGYVPKYNPENGEFGCLADSPNLRRRYKVLDKEQPDTQDTSANNVEFNARLALDDAESLPIVRQPGTDGFRMDSAPLFTVTVGREWYMHTIYTVKATDTRKRRSIVHTYHSMLRSGGYRSRAKRAAADLTDTIGEQFNRGTQMMHIKLNAAKQAAVADDGTFISDPGVEDTTVKQAFPMLALIIGAAALLIVVVIVVGAVLYKRRQATPAAAAPKDEKTKGQYTGGKHIVVRKRGSKTRSAVKSQTSNSSGYSSSDGEEV
uniref:FRAS1-related extracellular matrix protein 2 n=1 Tax=Phallusia mammillata TaxID=59560 RepID=A0A6F9DDA8_9ASCI|nr:FRAS1-related extracellular matrix protein 2 [Phallusia mammillata]